MAKKIDMTKMGALLGNKSTPVSPASDAVQRGTEVKVSSKLSNDEIVNLSFKVPTGFRKRFKLAAVNAGITQNDLVVQALDCWIRDHSGSALSD